MQPQLLGRFNQAIHEQWLTTIHTLVDEAKVKNKFSSDAAQILADYAHSPGKFIRPTLFLASYWLFSGQVPDKKLMKLSMSFELLHLALLIQDDVMDQSHWRRNGPSLHKRFEQFHIDSKFLGDPVRYGENMAVLMSDILSNEAEKIWTQTKSSPRAYFDILKEEVYWGQYLDVAQTAHAFEPNLDLIIEIAKRKTGEYTIYRPMQIGAIAAGQTEEKIKWLAEFCLDLGVAYQIIDDILGTYGNEDITGKSVKSDLDERKLTPLVYYAFELANDDDKALLLQWYRDCQNDTQLRLACQKIFMTYPIRDKSQQLAEQWFKKSLISLDKASLSPDKKHLLRDFAEFIIKREK